MKLRKTVYGHTILAKFNNQPNRFSHSRVMALYLYSNWQICIVPSLTQTVVVWSSWTCLITTEITLHILQLWLLVFTKNAKLVYALVMSVCCDSWQSCYFSLGFSSPEHKSGELLWLQCIMNKHFHFQSTSLEMVTRFWPDFLRMKHCHILVWSYWAVQELYGFIVCSFKASLQAFLYFLSHFIF